MTKHMFWHLELVVEMKTTKLGIHSTNCLQWFCLSVSLVENGHSYSKFVFVSDRDKGLDKSLAEIFPSNHAMNSVHHIKQNVKSRFGAKAAEMVFPIAHAFSMIKKKLYWSS